MPDIVRDRGRGWASKRSIRGVAPNSSFRIGTFSLSFPSWMMITVPSPLTNTRWTFVRRSKMTTGVLDFELFEVVMKTIVMMTRDWKHLFHCLIPPPPPLPLLLSLFWHLSHCNPRLDKGESTIIVLESSIAERESNHKTRMFHHLTEINHLGTWIYYNCLWTCYISKIQRRTGEIFNNGRESEVKKQGC